MSKINFIIPMAGEGSRFKAVGYKLPKPFIEVKGKTMIENVLDNLFVENAHYYLPALEAHLIEHASIIEKIKSRYNATFIPVSSKTEGAACTTLLAQGIVDESNELVIANSDQIVDFAISDFLESSRKFDGNIITFQDDDPKWSYAKVESGRVVEVREKKVISNNATVGIYYYKTTGEYFKRAHEMIEAGDRHNGEFYVCPVYNYFVKAGKNISIYPIERESMHGIGTPEDLEIYLSK